MYLFDAGKVALRPPTADEQRRLFLPERAVSRPAHWCAWVGAALGLVALGWAYRSGKSEVGTRKWARRTDALTPSPSARSVFRVRRSAFAVPRSADRPPSLSAAQIDTILAEYHSPATGLGAVFYDQGVAVGIDPAYLLSFFVVESVCGTRGVARTTHSIGNIRCTPGYACVDGYRAYPTWTAGSADWYTLLRTLYLDTWHLRTPAAILPRYAPPGDGNDPAAYATSVIQLIDGWSAFP